MLARLCRLLPHLSDAVGSQSISMSTSALKCVRGASLNSVSKLESTPELDKLFSKVHLEIRGHDKAVLKSYTTFLQTACHHLSIECSPVKVLPYVRWIQPLLRSKFVHKKYKLHYETRTHIRCMTISDVTGSTASTFLEYIERNIPEGVAMKVTYEELLPFPQMIAETMEKKALTPE
uniref:Small ribosomal subunit protein uS10m n=2 Tax=Ascaris TaxID=6251 RepID=A0A0M3I635_ASCLU